MPSPKRFLDRTLVSLAVSWKSGPGDFEYLDRIPKGDFLLSRIKLVLVILSLVGSLNAQIPISELDPYHQAVVQDILKRKDFSFKTRTSPRRVSLATVEKLFDRPRLAAAMWRHCQFSPIFYALEMPEQSFFVSDGRGLHGTMTLIYKKPGYRVYIADGRVEAGRMGNPFAVGAKMITVYHYWDGPKGFESRLETWTALDSALLGALTRPFRGYIQRRQEEFIAYINQNIAQGGEFAELGPDEFRMPLRSEGDPVAIQQFEKVFRKKKPRRGYGQR